MAHIFRYFKDYSKTIIIIILLLIVQAICDLGLPQYTSDIVDIGITQSGIERITPSEIRKETLNVLTSFLTEEEEAFVKSAYTESPDDPNLLILNTKKGEVLDELDSLLGMPMAMLSEDEGVVNQGTTLKLTRAEKINMKNKIWDQMGNLGGTIIYQRALLFLKREYQVIGINLGRLQTSYLLKTGGKMLGLSFVMMTAAVIVGLLASRVAAKIGMTLRGKVFKKVISFSSQEIDQFSTASLITRTTNDIQQIQQVSVMLLRMIAYAPILGIGGIIKVTMTRTGMGWIIVVGVIVISIVVGILLVVAMPKFKKMQTLVDRLNLVSREILTGISAIRAFTREEFEEKRFDVASRELMKTQLFTNRVMTFMMPLMTFIMNMLSIVIVWVGGQRINTGSLEVGDMMAFITYTMLIVMSFLMLSMVSIMLPRAGVAALRIDEVLNKEPTILDIDKAKDEEIGEGTLTFEDVSFRYPDTDQYALEHISFTARPGQVTAIIGSTGCGKSTLIHLIPRFYDVTKGRILLDGIDIREISQEKLRKSLGFVPQKGILFSGDIRSNIKFGGASITEEKMKEAAQIAQAQEFIESKPEAYGREISQGGTNVSGGQKQRLSIARAIAKSPQVFLFDDCFSALDYKTDVAVRRGLKEKISAATVIIVAQRISTILHADQIIVLEKGKIAGIGTHETLLATCKTYQEIAKSQLSEKELKGGIQGEPI